MIDRGKKYIRVDIRSEARVEAIIGRYERVLSNRKM